MNDQRLKRWRLVLGAAGGDEAGEALTAKEAAVDRILEALYDADEERTGGLGASSPAVARWLADIRTFFPRSVVQVMQRDALERLDLKRMLLEPELLDALEPDVALVSTLLSLAKALPTEARETARAVVRQVVDALEARLRAPLLQATRGALHRASRGRRPRSAAEVDWDRTIRRNLKHWLPDRKTLVPAELVGYGRRRTALQDVVLCVDQSASMATSVVYAGVLACVLATLRAIRTQLVVFDTEVVDLTEVLDDPLDVLFGTQLGGGTDIDRALAYAQTLVTRPDKTILVLVTDLFEGGDASSMLGRVAELVAAGVTVVCLLALTDQGAPAYEHGMAVRMAALGVPTFACSPDQFPDLMAAAIERRDLLLWAARNDIVATRAGR